MQSVKKYWFFILTLLFIVSSACARRKFNSNSASTAATQEAWENLSQAELFRREAQSAEIENASAAEETRRNFDSKARQYDVYSYGFKLNFDWNAQLLQGTVEIRFTPKSGTLRQLTLDSAVKIKAVTALDGTALAFSQNDSSQELSIQLLETGASALDERMRDPKNKLLAVRVEYETRWPNVPASRLKNGLLLSSVSPGDPVKTQILYTNSEPSFASFWAPLNIDPNDRAVVSFQATTAAEHDFVANGRRVSSSVKDGRRETLYEINKPIPSYITAFAAGPMESVADNSHSVPMRVWFRRGAGLPAKANLKLFAKAMSFLESRLGKYPWEEYGKVLIPEFGGGEENVSLTFQTDISSMNDTTEPELAAHELTHQWFGDFMTVRTWNDLWVKEGMATLLAAEFAELEFNAHGGVGYPGYSSSFSYSDAVRDDSLAPSKKYTSGPYSRAATVYNQIRQAIGEVTFWNTLRKLLQDKALSSISTDEVLAAFRPHLTGTQFATLKNTLKAKVSSSLNISRVPLQEGLYKISFSDPANTELVNLDVAEVNNLTGDIKMHVLAPGGTIEVRHDSATTTVIDPQGWRSLFTLRQARTQFKARGDGVEAILTSNRLGSVALVSLQKKIYSAKFSSLIATNSNEFSVQELLPVLTQAKDERVRMMLLNKSCQWVKGAEVARLPEWKKSIPQLFAELPQQYMNWPVFYFAEKNDIEKSGVFGKCPISWFERFGGADVKAALQAPLTVPSSQIFALANLDFSYNETMKFWHDAVLQKAPSLVLKDLAMLRLRNTFDSGFTPPQSDILPSWEPLVLKLITSTSNPALYSAMDIAAKIKSRSLLSKTLAKVAAVESSWWVTAVCMAWPTFADAPLGEWANSVAPFKSMSTYMPEWNDRVLSNTAKVCGSGT